MKKVLYILVTILTITKISFASTRGDVKILEATENIQYLSQKIATDYLFFYKNPNNIVLKNQLYKNIDNLQFYIKELEDIEDIRKGGNTERILKYFKYKIKEIKVNIKSIPNKKINLSYVEDILDSSDILLEGIQSIANEHKYKFSKEEKMLMLSKEILYLLRRVNKYYMALSIGLNSNTNYQKMQKAIEDTDIRLKMINRYTYPNDLYYKLDKINKIWDRDKRFFYQVDKLSIPYILSNSTQYIEDLVTQIEQYHKRNL
ncbi:MAG: hypothetical protein GXO60_06920 [Epsilonproteobacteria bacterium]|nr:hypothetical protein [Campylobacterota bacterium]